MKKLLGYKYLLETNRSKTGKIALYLFYRDDDTSQRTDLMLLAVSQDNPNCEGTILESGPVLVEIIFDKHPDWKKSCHQKKDEATFYYAIVEE